MRNTLRIFIAGLLFSGSTLALHAQFYQVYGYTTPGANEKELVYWTTYIPSSDQSYSFFGDTVSRQGMFAHSMELEYGITNNLTVAIYFDFEQPKGQNCRWVYTKGVMLYYQLFQKNLLLVDLALYAEYKLPRKGYKHSEEIEFKLIMEKDITPFIRIWKNFLSSRMNSLMQNRLLVLSEIQGPWKVANCILPFSLIKTPKIHSRGCVKLKPFLPFTSDRLWTFMLITDFSWNKLQVI